ncbi:hypothetical protein [Candidatus Macondimonas diazotrophica]|uniref:hypothetical protein n=1 Tax=Candidatus Macondimonas diazotrophica TaxID=2305248 RepID=UPI001432745C|nr:hypothetical protein [Candidatus Macondimonas diazotrophica]
MKRTKDTDAISTMQDNAVQAFVPHPLPPSNPPQAPEAFPNLNHQAEPALARLSAACRG